MGKNAYLFVSCSLGSPDEQKTPKGGMLSISQGAQSYYSCTSCSKLYEDYSYQKGEGFTRWISWSSTTEWRSPLQKWKHPGLLKKKKLQETTPCDLWGCHWHKGQRFCKQFLLINSLNLILDGSMTTNQTIPRNSILMVIRCIMFIEGSYVSVENM